MSALSILYLVLPFPLLFVLHEVEEVAVQHRWMSAHSTSLVLRFPKMRPMIEHLSHLSTKAFAIAALEELAVLLSVTCYVLAGGAYALQLWSALFIAFAVHLTVHVGQAVAVKSYVPGLATSLLLLPYATYGLWSIWLATNGWELIAWGTIGLAVTAANLRFAHWLGIQSDKSHLT